MFDFPASELSSNIHGEAPSAYMIFWYVNFYKSFEFPWDGVVDPTSPVVDAVVWTSVKIFFLGWH